MPQQTSSELTVGYNTKRVKCLRERLELNYHKCEKTNNVPTYLKVCWEIYKKLVKKKFLATQIFV